jgi:hypothetical protein
VYKIGVNRRSDSGAELLGVPESPSRRHDVAGQTPLLRGGD